MKKHRLALTLGLLACASAAPAQTESTYTLLDPVKPTTYCNPVSGLVMWADPTAVEYEERLYVYGSNDQQEYDGNEGVGNNTYGKIKSLQVMSTTDMINWTHHGQINMATVCGSWLACSWAPSIVSRVEDDGLTHFYLYFSNSGGGVGVVTSTSPVGPWTSPRNSNLVQGGTPGLGPCCWPFDPGVVIDDNGVGWLTLGGGDPLSGATDLQPGNAHIVRLGADMVSLDGDFAHIPAPYQFEASELNMIGGKYVYTYCSSWRARTDWSKYSTTKPSPSICSMCYMVTDNPMDESSWVYGGEYLANPSNFGYPGGNNHTHLHKYNDKYYLFYHTQVMENLAGISGGYRSIAVNEAQVDESTCTISPVTATNKGADEIESGRLDARERQQAETMWTEAGVSLKSRSKPGNTALTAEAGSWIAVKNVNFGDEPVNTFTAKIRGTGKLEIRVGRLKAKPSGVLEYSGTTVKDQSVTLTSEIKGTQTLYFVFTEANSNTLFDEWQFSTEETEGISDVAIDAEIADETYYSVDGTVSATPRKGINIRRVSYTDGTTRTEKIILP